MRRLRLLLLGGMCGGEQGGQALAHRRTCACDLPTGRTGRPPLGEEEDGWFRSESLDSSRARSGSALVLGVGGP